MGGAGPFCRNTLSFRTRCPGTVSASTHPPIPTECWKCVGTPRAGGSWGAGCSRTVSGSHPHSGSAWLGRTCPRDLTLSSFYLHLDDMQKNPLHQDFVLIRGAHLGCCSPGTPPEQPEAPGGPGPGSRSDWPCPVRGCLTCSTTTPPSGPRRGLHLIKDGPVCLQVTARRPLTLQSHRKGPAGNPVLYPNWHQQILDTRALTSFSLGLCLHVHSLC